MERLRTEPAYYSYNHHRYAYTGRGIYVEQLRRWTEHFPREQLLVLQSEWLFRDPPGASEAVYRFLGLRPHRLAKYETFLRGNYERGMPPEIRARLAASSRRTTARCISGWARSTTGPDDCCVAGRWRLDLSRVARREA